MNREYNKYYPADKTSHEMQSKRSFEQYYCTFHGFYSQRQGFGDHVIEEHLFDSTQYKCPYDGCGYTKTSVDNVNSHMQQFHKHVAKGETTKEGEVSPLEPIAVQVSKNRWDQPYGYKDPDEEVDDNELYVPYFEKVQERHKDNKEDDDSEADRAMAFM